MAYSEEHAEILRNSLADLKGITEKKMFGGLCFLLRGNMICGVHKEGGMMRVGKESEAEALAWNGVEPLSFTGRRMGGMVDIDFDAIEDEEIRTAVLQLAKEYVGTLPAK